MLERMREFSKSWAIKILLGLVALSFIGYFGQSPFQKARQERLISAVKVNGQIVTTNEFYRQYTLLRQDLERRQGWALDEDQQRQVAQRVLESLIDQALQEQWLRKVGVQATDEEVGQEITQMLARFSEGRPVSPQLYMAVLNQLGYRSPKDFEQTVRTQLSISKLSQLLAQGAKISQPELREAYAQSQRQAKVTAVGFRPEDYMEGLSPAREQLYEYYSQRQEHYRKPERVQVYYLEILPEKFQGEVTVVDGRLQQYFEQNQEKYKLEAKASADYVRFDPMSFQDQIILTDEEIQQYYQENPDRYQKEERIKVRYVPIALSDPQGPNAPNDRAIRKTFLDSEEDFVQLEVNQILRRTLPYVWGGAMVAMKRKPRLLPFDKNPADYDLIIIGTPVWNSTMAPPVRSFLDNCSSAVKRAALFCCYSGGVSKTFAEMKELLGKCIAAGEQGFLDPLGHNESDSSKAARGWAKSLI